MAKMFQEAPAPLRELDYLNAAAEVVRSYCGWHVTPVLTETLVLDEPEQGVLLLPSARVEAVEEVKVRGQVLDPTAYEWSEDGRLRLHSFCYSSDLSHWGHRRGRLRGVEVTLRHGYDEEQAAGVLAIIRGVAARAAMSPGGNLAYQAAGTQRVGFQSSSGAGTSNSLPLMQVEKDTLAAYRLEWGPRC